MTDAQAVRPAGGQLPDGAGLQAVVYRPDFCLGGPILIPLKEPGDFLVRRISPAKLNTVQRPLSGSSIWNRFLTAPFRDPLPVFAAIADPPVEPCPYDDTRASAVLLHAADAVVRTYLLPTWRRQDAQDGQLVPSFRHKSLIYDLRHADGSTGGSPPRPTTESLGETLSRLRSAARSTVVFVAATALLATLLPAHTVGCAAEPSGRGR